MDKVSARRMKSMPADVSNASASELLEYASRDEGIAQGFAFLAEACFDEFEEGFEHFSWDERLIVNVNSQDGRVHFGGGVKCCRLGFWRRCWALP